MHTYLALERVVVDAVMMDRAKVAFMERLEKRRAKEVLVKEEKKVLAPVTAVIPAFFIQRTGG